MKKILLFFLISILFAKNVIEIKPYKTLSENILGAKKIDGKIYYVLASQWVNKKCNYKDFFVINGYDIEVGANDNEVCVVKLGGNLKILKKVTLKGKFVKALYIDNLYIVTTHKLYVFDSMLHLKYKRDFTYKIKNFFFYKNKFYILNESNLFVSLDGKIKNFSKGLKNKKNLKYMIIGGKLFVLYKKNSVSDYEIKYKFKRGYILKNLTDGYEIKLYTLPRVAKIINGDLYIAEDGLIEKFHNNKFLWGKEIKKKVLSFLNYNKNVYVVFPNEFDIIKESLKIKGLFCKKLTMQVINIFNVNNPLIVTKNSSYEIRLVDKNLNVIWHKKIDGKINSAKLIDGFIYLVGSKNGRFWIAKINKNGDVLKQTLLYKASQGFDLVKTPNGFMAVGYKYFDHLGNYIKRIVIILLDKNLNFITDRAYGNEDGVGEKIFNYKNAYLIEAVMKNIPVFLFIDNKGFLYKYKVFKKEVIYDVKVLNNGDVLFSTDNGMFLLKDEAKFEKINNCKYIIKIFSKNSFAGYYGNDSFLVKNSDKKEYVDFYLQGAVKVDYDFYFIGEDLNNKSNVICRLR